MYSVIIGKFPTIVDISSTANFVFRNNGFLKYWTFSNLPLFLIASPMLALMVLSAWAPMRNFGIAFGNWRQPTNKVAYGESQAFSIKCLIRLAVPQMIFAVLAITNSHVQIINRVATGYVLPYVFAADLLLQEYSGSTQLVARSRVIIHWMVMYAMIQGGLYASFLPPA